MYQFEITRSSKQLGEIQQSFKRYRDYFIDKYEHLFHVSDLQIHVQPKKNHIGITTWPQFIPTIAPPADYLMINHLSDVGYHVHLGKMEDVLDVVVHLGYQTHKTPVPHIKLPHIVDVRWHERILSVAKEIDFEEL